MVPALEVLGVYALFNIVGRIAGTEASQVTPASMWRNLRGGWEVDGDEFLVNQIAHPYHGSLYFNAARSSNLGFWWSSGYTLLGSLGWEYLMENQPPSLNDGITTTFSGIVLGEVLHRVSEAILWNGGREPTWAMQLAAIAVNPLGAFNSGVLNQPTRVERPPSLFAAGNFGFGFQSTERLDDLDYETVGQLHLGVDISYGLPGDPDLDVRKPFEHFDLSLNVNLSTSSADAGLFLRGLVVGEQGVGERLAGLWGLFAGHEFFTPEGLRAGAFFMGPGGTLEARLGAVGFLQFTSVTGLVPIGAIGRNVGGERDYHLGPGFSQLLEFRLGFADIGLLRLTSRYMLLVEGDEYVSNTRTILSVLFGLAGRHGLGAELVTAASRHEHEGTRDTWDSGTQVRVFYSILTDRGFGGHPR